MSNRQETRWRLKEHLSELAGPAILLMLVLLSVDDGPSSWGLGGPVFDAALAILLVIVVVQEWRKDKRSFLTKQVPRLLFLLVFYGSMGFYIDDSGLPRWLSATLFCISAALLFVIPSMRERRKTKEQRAKPVS